MKNKFNRRITGDVSVLLEYENVSLHEYYTDVDSVIRAYRSGRPKMKEIFGEDIIMPMIHTPSTGYGHASGLGAKITVPPGDGELSVSPMFDNLEEAVSHLKKSIGMDFSKTGIVPQHLAFRQKLTDAFPGEPFWFGACSQGVITTAFLLSGQEIYYELYDNPELLKEYLKLLTISITEYDEAISRLVYNCGHFNAESGYLADDCAALIPPGLFPEFVLNFWEMHYKACTIGKRNLHCEGLTVPHLKYIEEAKIDLYDPGVSPLLTPDLIAKNCGLQFEWRLAGFHLWNMTVQQVRDFVCHCAADGASGTFLCLTYNMSEGENLKKVQAYIETCKEVSKALEKGENRENIRSMAAQKNGKEFWNDWIGYKGGKV